MKRGVASLLRLLSRVRKYLAGRQLYASKSCGGEKLVESLVGVQVRNFLYFAGVREASCRIVFFGTSYSIERTDMIARLLNSAETC